MNKNYINLKKNRVKELKALCKKNKIRGYSKLKKKQLVELLFKNLFPNEEKVIIKKPVKEKTPEPVKEKTPEPVKEKTPEPTPKEEEHPLKIKVDILDDVKVEPIPEKKDFEKEYEKALQKNIQKLKEKKEKKEKKKKLKKIIIDLNDKDYITTINNLIRKLY